MSFSESVKLRRALEVGSGVLAVGNVGIEAVFVSVALDL